MKRFKLISIAIMLLLTVELITATLSNASELPLKEVLPEDMSANVRAQLEKLHSSDTIERRNASLKLWELGKNAVPAVPFILLMLNDEDWRVRKDAIYALTLIGDDRAVKPLEKILSEDPSLDVRKAASIALRSLQTKIKGVCEF
jgi:HEAT repeat protein